MTDVRTALAFGWLRYAKRSRRAPTNRIYLLRQEETKAEKTPRASASV